METGINPITPPQVLAAPDRTQYILGFVHDLLVARYEDQLALPGLLTELARAYAASGAGLILGTGSAAIKEHVGIDGPPASLSRLPWDEDPELLEKAARATTGQAWR